MTDTLLPSATSIRRTEDPTSDTMTEEITTTKMITKNGTSLTINITKEIKQLELDRGDLIEVTIRKK